MATTDEVLEKLVDVLFRITRPPEKESFFKYLLKHPIVVTAVGSLLVAYGTNWVTKEPYISSCADSFSSERRALRSKQ